MGAEQGIVNYPIPAWVHLVLTHFASEQVRGEMALSDLIPKSSQDVIPPIRKETFPWPHRFRFGDLKSLWKKRGMGLTEKVVQFLLCIILNK